MHALFAVEPSAISNWQDFRYVIEKFGFSKGLLIARYPSKWPKLVLDACKVHVSDNEYLKIVERLSQAKDDRLFKKGIPYNPDDTWRGNVSDQDVIRLLDGVLVDYETDEDKFYFVGSTPEALFENRREKPIKRKATELARAAEYLVADATTLFFVDPYFQAKGKCVKVLEQIISTARSYGDKLKNIVVFSAYSIDPRLSAQVKNDYQSRLNGWINQGVIFQFYRLDDENLDWDFHARYLFSEIAGLRFDRGFVEPEDHGEREHETDVACLEPGTVEKLLAKYCSKEQGLGIIDCIALKDDSA